MADSDALTSLLADLACNPWKLRHLRQPINQAAGRPASARVSDILARHYIGGLPGADVESVLFPEISAATLGQATVLREAEPFDVPQPEFLSDERPDAIVARLAARPPCKSITGYVSEPGSYVSSFAFGIPVTFADGHPPALVVEQSSHNYDSIYIKGGRHVFAQPALRCDTLAIVFDEFLGPNYAHWLLDWMPRFSLLRDLGVDLKSVTLLLPRPPVEFQWRMLAMVGIAPSQCAIVRNQEDFAASSIAYRRFVGTSCTGPTFAHGLHAGSQWAAAFVRTCFGAGAAPPASLRLLVDRRKNRRLVFDEATMALLDRAGFKTVYLEDLTIDEQVALFARAQAILGAHGAGLANIVFAAPGTPVLEIFPEDYSTPGYWLAAHAAGLMYSCAVGSSTAGAAAGASFGKHIRDQDIFCPKRVIEAWLDSLAEP